MTEKLTSSIDAWRNAKTDVEFEVSTAAGTRSRHSPGADISATVSRTVTDRDESGRLLRTASQAKLLSVRIQVGRCFPVGSFLLFVGFPLGRCQRKHHLIE